MLCIYILFILEAQIFEDFNMAEVLYKNSEHIIIDISLLNDSKKGFDEKGINIFRGRCN